MTPTTAGSQQQFLHPSEWVSPKSPPVNPEGFAPVSRRVAKDVARAFEILCGEKVQVHWWDGTVSGSPRHDALKLTFTSPRAFSRLIGGAPERAFGRAFVEGLIEIDPLERFLAGFSGTTWKPIAAALPRLARSAFAVGARPWSAPVPGAEARLTGKLHSRGRDAAAIAHHYDVATEFYQLWLDDTMSYSCAYFSSPTDDLTDAQTAKLELVCRKLRLKPGEKVLDVGCGWGGFAIHAARHHGVHVTGITLSGVQARYARGQVKELGLQDAITILEADYRDPLPEKYDAVASIGMVEHVGRENLPVFATQLASFLRPQGRLLMHGITLREHEHFSKTSFLDAFVFPDGELYPVSDRDAVFQRAGFELRDVECLREHYALTLGQWITRLLANWDRAVELVGIERARVWLLYMTGAKVGFENESVGIYQSLFVKPNDQGVVDIPLRRNDWWEPVRTHSPK